MKTKLWYTIGLMSAFAFGFAAAHFEIASTFAGTEETADKPAYLIVSVDNVQSDKLGPYKEAGKAAAEKAGFQYLAAGNTDGTIHVLEGEWPYTGSVGIDKLDSMDALLEFWYSPEYQEAKKLREGLMDVNFIIAIDSL